MLISDLTSKVEREVQGEIDETKQYDIADLRASVLSGIEELSAIYPQQYAISGTSESESVSPEPDVYGLRAIVLISALVLLRREKIKASVVAMTLSNASGRTDLSTVPEAIGGAISTLQTRLNQILSAINRADVESQMSSREKTRQEVE